MKKLIAVFSIMVFVLVYSNTATAQQYFTYDGPAFNVLLKCNSANTQVLEVSFTDAAKSSWIPFSIVDYYDVSDGFGYVVEDGVGNRFNVDYYAYQDYIGVQEHASGYQWTLYRR